MTGSEWFTDRIGNIYYGSLTDNQLTNTNGVYVCAYEAAMFIAFFDEEGMTVGSYIRCDEDSFKIIYD